MNKINIQKLAAIINENLIFEYYNESLFQIYHRVMGKIHDPIHMIEVTYEIEVNPNTIDNWSEDDFVDFAKRRI